VNLDAHFAPFTRVRRMYRADHFGCEASTVRAPGDLGPLQAWLDGPRERPLVIDAKISSEHGSWWLEEAFRGH
jgi:acetolactate synthase I/II/III large subunit